MKKKIFALITALALVAILCLSLVACDDNDGDSPKAIRFTENMSKEEIIEKIGDIRNCTVEVYNDVNEDGHHTGTVALYGTYYYGEVFACYSKPTFSAWEFVEDGRCYGIGEERYDDGEVDGFIDIFEATDETLDYFEETIVYYRDMVINAVNSGEYSIVDGGIKVAADNGYNSYYIVKDCNSTKMPTVPEKYKDYKNFELTTDEDAE